MPLRTHSLVLAFLLTCGALRAEHKLAVLGLGEEKSLDSVAVQLALDASNSRNAEKGVRLRPWLLSPGEDAASNLERARMILDDPEVMAVVLHGEAAAAPEIIELFRAAGLATVVASAWAQPRAKEPFATWLCPSATEMAEASATYARKEAKQIQVAVLDNGAPTAVAAAKAFSARFRALGGKVVFEGEWQGTEWGLTRSTKALKANWPQMLFFAGEAEEAGRLVVAMKDEKELKRADLIGQPTVFEPIFFDTARLKSVRTRGIFPSPDFQGTQALVRLIGFAFPKTSAEYRAYVQVAYKKPGRWSAMLFDAVSLAARGIVEGVAEGDVAPERANSLKALNAIESYRGIRGSVKFNANREPAETRVMVYYALNKVNQKVMQWTVKNYGPPF